MRKRHRAIIISGWFLAAITTIDANPGRAQNAALKTATTATTRIPLRLQNVASAPRRNWPVTTGVPLPRGVLRDEKHARLLDETGRERDLQTRVTARWNDNSIKWLLLDFQVNAPAASTTSYALELGPNLRRHAARPLKVVSSANEIAVDAGRVRFSVPRRATAKNGFSWLSKLSIETPNGATWKTLLAPRDAEAFAELEHVAPGAPEEENWLRASGGPRDRYAAARDRAFSATLEESGPLRVTLRLEAWHINQRGQRFAPLHLRLSAFRDSPQLRVLHTFTFSGDPKTDYLRSLGLRLPLAGRNVQAQWGAGGSASRAVPIDGARSLVQIGPTKIYHNAPLSQDKRVAWTLAQDKVLSSDKAPDKVLSTGHDAPGWLRARTSAGAVTFALRDWAHQHPKQFCCSIAPANRTPKSTRNSMRLWFKPLAPHKVLCARRGASTVICPASRRLWATIYRATRVFSKPENPSCAT